jgi:hypothetical protein
MILLLRGMVIALDKGLQHLVAGLGWGGTF